MPSYSEDWNPETRLLVGDRLRRTRLHQRLSIRQVAEIAKISKTSVLQVEAGRTSRRTTYIKVAESMGLHFERLTQPGPTAEPPYAMHLAGNDKWYDLAAFGEGPLPETAQANESERKRLALTSGIQPLNILACRLEQGRIKPTILELYGPSAVRSHNGEEHVFVLSGQAIVSVGGKGLPLNAGESVTFWSSEPHFYAPVPGSPLPVKVLSIRVDA